jgi:hypothetical protein
MKILMFMRGGDVHIFKCNNPSLMTVSMATVILMVYL